MPGAIEFGLLGALVVRTGNTEVPVRRGHQRALLATLLLNANRLVPVEAITDALWGTTPPRTAPVAVRSYIRRLRLALGQAGQERISTQPRGYLISVADDELDLTRFEHLLVSAREAARRGCWPDAAQKAREALSCWRGEPLADIESDTLALSEVPRLTELRLQAVETRIDADLRLGGHAEAAAELQRLCMTHPLREGLHALLMLSLYRSGRRAEALDAYQRARSFLVEELGSEPGPELQALQRQLLNDDPSLGASAPGKVAAGTLTQVVPRQLPAVVGCFSGRGPELAALSAILGASGAEGTRTMVISAIGGTAGVGKTALAVRWAHEVAHHFPDGHLYVNLRGYDPGQPLAAEEALAGFLAALGVSGSQIPAEADGRAATYRSALAGRRVLVVLDNARDAEQVRPLLPGEPGCLVLVTSRDMLAGLVARDGARRVLLDVLPLNDAVALLRALIGPRVDAEPQAAARLALLCCCLPLALRVAAEFAAARPAMSIVALAGELDGQGRLDVLEAGADPGTAVRAVFSWSCRYLSPAAARAFRLVALHPGADFDSRAVAALTGTSYPATCRALGELTRACLLGHVGQDRYGMHDLLRAYGRELATSDTSQAGQHAALTRLLDHYQHTAASAMGMLFPAHAVAMPVVQPPASPAPPLADAAAARAWLAAERPNLVAAAIHAADHGWPAHAIGLASALYYHLDLGGHYREALTIHACACRAARRLGDRGAEAEALRNAGVVEVRRGRHVQAMQHFDQALALFRETGDRAGQARTLGSVANLAWDNGRYQQASHTHREVLDLFLQADNRVGQAAALVNLGVADGRQGHYPQAAEHFQRALALSQETGNRNCEGYALRGLGEAAIAQGSYPQAADHLKLALDLFRDTADRKGEADALHDLGDLDRRLGRYRRAADHYRMALAICREMEYSHGQAEALNGLGAALLAMGKPQDALHQHNEARNLAHQSPDPYDQARAHQGLGNAYAATGDYIRAREQWQQALAIYTRLGTPDADQIRAQLSMNHQPS